ncbi:MAG: glyoxalase [Pseudomonadales bacterium]
MSKRFYTALGCKLEHESEKLATYSLGERRFYLQDFYVKEFVEQYMLHLLVEDVEAWHEHVQKVLADFPSTAASLPKLLGAPKHEPYGATVCYALDPSGVLIHIAQFDD